MAGNLLLQSDRAVDPWLSVVLPPGHTMQAILPGWFW